MRPLMRVALVVVGFAALVVLIARNLPPAWDPRTPLDLTAAPNWLAASKLAWMRRDPQACFAAFATSAIVITRVPDRPSTTGCEIENAVRLASTLRTSPPSPTVTCAVAAAWTMFERHTLQAAAREQLGQEVVGIRHLGTQSCRNIGAGAVRSQHATANAIDVAGFILRDGREVRVVADWHGPPRDAAFLRAVRDGACRWFRVVLSPDYNDAHRDHFHLDMGRWGACR
ncbi:MAG: extensin [Rhodospirillales bacterium]|nr:extensin [Rhodospirillales bacterium]